MPRNSTNADKKLINVGRKLLIKNGASSLNIRELTALAGVNLGMFSYYFKTKENFLRRVLEEIYENFLSDLHTNTEADDVARLRSQLLVMAKFSRDNRVLILSLMGDVLNDETVVQKFVKTKFKQHFILLAEAVQQCQEKGIIINAPLPLIVTQIIGSIGLTNLMPGAIKKIGVNKVFNTCIGVVTKQLTSDEALNQRVEIVLRGILAA